jgi:hypothetical protein
MHKWKRVFPFILLNIIISALTTMGVLWWWDNYQRPAFLSSLPLPIGLQEISHTSVSIDQANSDQSGATGQAEISILSVIAAGDPTNEAVLIKQDGEGATWLTGWRLFDQNGNTFIFPELLLNQNGAVQVFTRAGMNTVIELFWGLQEPVWSSKEMVTLVDKNNTIRATYQIP